MEAQKVIEIYNVLNRNGIKLRLAAIVFLFSTFLLTDVIKSDLNILGIDINHSQSLKMEVLIAPTPFRVMGEDKIIYEVHLMNDSQQPLTLEKLEILGDGEDVLKTFGKPELRIRLQSILFFTGSHPISEEVDLLQIKPGERKVLYLEFALGEILPTQLRHRFYFHQQGNLKVAEGGKFTLSNKTAVVLGVPLQGGPWVAVYSSKWKRGHRRYVYTKDSHPYIPGRIAIDFIKVDKNGFVSHGDKNIVQNWLGYGVEVFAVADARVAAVHDGVQESPTISGHINPPSEKAAGNYIVLDLGNGTYVFYEHLKAGSIRVEPGDYVKKGQMIAQLGFTGQINGGPHLHFSMANKPSALYAEGLPFMFEGFTLLGRYPNITRLGKPWIPLSDSIRPQRKAELPASNTVLYFGKVSSP